MTSKKSSKLTIALTQHARSDTHLRNLSVYQWLFVSALFMVSFSGFAVPSGEAYNEGQAPDGRSRETYNQLSKATGVDVLRPSQQAREFLQGTPLNDTYYQISPLPLVVGEETYRGVIKKGVQQRAKVLRAFFEDIVLGDQKAITSGIVPRKIVELIFRESDVDGSLENIRNIWKNRTANDISFLYGPDLMKSPSGEWLVIEDNVGNLGGLGNTEAIRESYTRAVGIAESDTVPTDLKDLAKYFMATYNLNPESVSFAGANTRGLPEKGTFGKGDSISYRRNQVLTKLGLKEMSGESLPNKGHASQGIINFGAPYFDTFITLDHFALRQNFYLMNSVGTNALTNKALLAYVEPLLKLYFGEDKPLILKSAPTKTYILDMNEDTGPWDEYKISPSRKAIVDEIVSSRNSVLKATASEQGQGVYLFTDSGPTKAAYTEAVDKDIRQIQYQRQQYGMNAIGAGKSSVLMLVLQDFIPSAYLELDGEVMNVDIRPLALQAGSKPAFVAENLWGRAQMMKKSMLSNIAQGAMNLPVFRVSCENIF